MSKLLPKDIIDYLEVKGNIYQGHYWYKEMQRPRVRFVISSIDEALLNRIKDILGMGSVCYNKQASTYMYTIAAAGDVYDFLMKMKKYLSPGRMTQLFVAYQIYVNKVKEAKYINANHK